MVIGIHEMLGLEHPHREALIAREEGAAVERRLEEQLMWKRAAILLNHATSQLRGSPWPPDRRRAVNAVGAARWLTPGQGAHGTRRYWTVLL
jgi:hypothetical protein